MTAKAKTSLGLTEQELRDVLSEELRISSRVESQLDAIAHSVARAIELDHLRMAEQLASVGVELDPSDDASPTPS